MDAPPTAPTLFRRIRDVVERLAVAHFAGYPIAFIWAAASIPLTIHLSIGVIDTMGGDMDKIGQMVVHRVAWPAGAVFLVAHAAAIPWIVARDFKAGLRRTLVALASLVVLGVIFGAGSWLWLMLR